jgi:hypothetical protein
LTSSTASVPWPAKKPAVTGAPETSPIGPNGSGGANTPSESAIATERMPVSCAARGARLAVEARGLGEVLGGATAFDQSMAKLPALGARHVDRRPVGEVRDAACAEGERVIDLPRHLRLGRIAVVAVRHGLDDEQKRDAVSVGRGADEEQVLEERIGGRRRP